MGFFQRLNEYENFSTFNRGTTQHLGPRHVNERALATIRAAIVGLTSPFKKRLMLVGKGYKAQMDGRTIAMWCGYTHWVYYTPPYGIRASVEKDEGSGVPIVLQGFDLRKLEDAIWRLGEIKKPNLSGYGFVHEGAHVYIKKKS